MALTLLSSFTVTVPVSGAPGVIDVLVTTSNGGTSAINQPGDEYTYLVTYFFAWYDHISSVGFKNDNIHVMNPAQPGEADAHVTVTIPGNGCGSQSATIAPQTEHIFSCATGFGGPIASAQPIARTQKRPLKTRMASVFLDSIDGGSRNCSVAQPAVNFNLAHAIAGRMISEARRRPPSDNGD